jgi:hypothetical protein
MRVTPLTVQAGNFGSTGDLCIDVLDMMGKSDVHLVEKAVFATISGTSTNERFRLCIHR